MNVASMTIDTLLRRNATVCGHKAAVVANDRSLTYAELDAEVDALAVALVSLGLHKGDRVAALFLNEWEYVITYFAVMRTGGVLVALNNRLVGEEIAYQVRDSGARFVVHSGEFQSVVGPLRSSLSVDHWITTGEAGSGSLDFRAVVDSGRGRKLEMAWNVGHEDPSGIWYTSGTTGLPKGAIATHASSIWSAVASALVCRLGRESRVLASAPLFHRGPMETLFLGGFVVGATHHLMHRFDPGELLRLVDEDAITHAFIVPAMTFAVLNLPDRGSYDLSSMECWLTASAPFPEEYRDRLEAETTLRPGRIYNAYGITESLFNSCLDPAQTSSHRGSVGTAVPGTELSIVDLERNAVPPGTVGEIAVCAASMAAGYIGRDDAWRAATYEEAGRIWYLSGDLGYLDADGYLYIVDRTKDMVISGGENVYSAEVESVLLQHPDIDEVAIVGTPDETWGECVTAVLVRRSGSSISIEDVRSFCRDRLAAYKHPRRVFFIDALPRNAFGKVRKNEVRELAVDLTSTANREPSSVGD